MKLKLKDILKESFLGEMPSSKLMKMKWNPVTEEDVFDTSGGDGAADEDPKGNMAVKKFNALVAGKSGWEAVKTVVGKIPSDIKQADFIEFLMKDLAISDTAKKKLKLRL
jgi:hypothetical protein